MSEVSSSTSSTVVNSTSAALLSRIQELRNWQAQQRSQLEPSKFADISTSNLSEPLSGNNDQQYTENFPCEGKGHTSNSGADYKKYISYRPNGPFQSYSTAEEDANETDLIKESEVLRSFKPSFAQESGVVEDRPTVIGAEANTLEALLGDSLEEVGVIKPQVVPKRKFLKKGEGLRRFMGVKAQREHSSDQGQIAQNGNLASQDQGSKMKVKRPFLKKGEGLRRWKDPRSLSITEDSDKNVRALAPKTSKKELFKQPIPKLRLQVSSNQTGPVVACKDRLEIPHEDFNSDLKESCNDFKEGSAHDVLKCSRREMKSSGVVLQLPRTQVEIEKVSRKEEKELNAFEKLEELAADSSFSSNSSTVIQLLQQGLHSQTSTPVKTSVSELTPLSSKRNSLSDASLLGAEIPVHQAANGNLLSRFIETASDLLELQGIIYEEPVLDKDNGHLDISEKKVKLSKLKQHSEVGNKVDLNLTQQSAQTVDNTCIQNLQGLVTPLHTKPTSRVHFRPVGADVLEYEGEDTLTDASSLTEDETELITTSELEALASLDWNFQERMRNCGLGSQFSELQRIDEEEMGELLIRDEEDVAKDSESLRKDENPCVLEFSPPSKRLPKCTSRPDQRNKRNSNEQKDIHFKEEINEEAKGKPFMHKGMTCPQPTQAESDVQTVKALLMTKVVELELEIENFKRESAKMSALQDKIQKEKKAFEDEKLTFKQEMRTEKEKLKKYIELEKQQLWKEKQDLTNKSHSQSKVDEDNIVCLKEKYEDLQNEVKKKEANHLASEKKLKDKLNFYEFENKSLKEKIVKMETLEKENKNLKLLIERLETTKKTTGLKSAQKTKVAQHGNTLINKNITFKSINKNINQQDYLRRDEKDISIQDVYPVRSINPKSLTRRQNPTCGVRFETCVNLASVQPLASSSVPAAPLDNCAATMAESVQDRYREEHTADQVEETTLALPLPPSAVGVDASLDAPPLDYTENYNMDGTLEIIYANGNKKEVHKNGTCIIHYYNGDVKEMHQDKVVYVYGSDQTRHTTYKDGMETVEFANGQQEVRHPDGSSEIIFTDKTKKMVSPDGSEELITSDGTVICTKPDGSKVFQFANGQREVHENGEKRREYPDGTIKILHSDGLVETHYRNGRRRVRDKEGNLLMDSIT